MCLLDKWHLNNHKCDKSQIISQELIDSAIKQLVWKQDREVMQRCSSSSSGYSPAGRLGPLCVQSVCSPWDRLVFSRCFGFRSQSKHMLLLTPESHVCVTAGADGCWRPVQGYWRNVSWEGQINGNENDATSRDTDSFYWCFGLIQAKQAT